MVDVALALEAEGFLLNRRSTTLRSSSNRVDPRLNQVLLDANGIVALLNMDCVRFRFEPDMLQEIIVSIGCRLVAFHPLCEPQLESRLDSAYHIGLTAFITTLFLQVGRRRFQKYGLVGQHLKLAIEKGLEEEDNSVMLWLLFVGGISVLEGGDQAWLHSRIHHVAASLELDSWDMLRQHLLQFPWIISLHDEPGKALWDAARMSPQRELDVR